MKEWHVYRLMSPIDFRWEHLKTAQETFATLAAGAEAIGTHGFAIAEDNNVYPTARTALNEAEHFLNAMNEASALASQIGWEGDVRGEVNVLWLPAEGTFDYGFVWKHDNNGDTFVAAPMPLFAPDDPLVDWDCYVKGKRG
jgi:hypothetical protein